MIDVQVAKHGPDDAVYERFSELKLMVPRGLVFLKCEDVWRRVLHGLYKFSGTSGNEDVDEDDELFDSSETGQDQLRLLQLATFFRLTKKENGRAGSMAVVRKTEDNFIVVVGTKLRHTVVEWNAATNSITYLEDLQQRPLVLQNVRAFQSSLEAYKRADLFQYMLDKVVTLNAEIIDATEQHIMEVPDGTLYAVFINLVEDTCYNPASQALLRSFAANADAERTLIQTGPEQSISEFLPNIKKIKMERHEGYVAVFYDENRTILGLTKVKCIWYQVLRAIREVTRNHFLGKLDTAAQKQREIIAAKESQLASLRSALEKAQQKGKANVEKKIKEAEEHLKTLMLSSDLEQTAMDVQTVISRRWPTKFDFLKNDIGSAAHAELMPKILCLARKFVAWYTKNDSICDRQTFYCTFPLIWKQFVTFDPACDEFLCQT